MFTPPNISSVPREGVRWGSPPPFLLQRSPPGTGERGHLESEAEPGRAGTEWRCIISGMGAELFHLQGRSRCQLSKSSLRGGEQGARQAAALGPQSGDTRPQQLPGLHRFLSLPNCHECQSSGCCPNPLRTPAPLAHTLSPKPEPPPWETELLPPLPRLMQASLCAAEHPVSNRPRRETGSALLVTPRDGDGRNHRKET